MSFHSKMGFSLSVVHWMEKGQVIQHTLSINIIGLDFWWR